MKYPKIQSLFKRDPNNNFKTFLKGEFSLPIFEYLWDCDALFYVEEKIDGINMRVIWKDGVLSFGGRKDDTQFFPGTLQLLQSYFKKHYFKEKFPNQDFVLYGEMYGGNIQKVGKHYGDLKFTIFDHLNLDTGNWMLRKSLEEFVYEHFPHTPRLDIHYTAPELSLSDSYEMVRDEMVRDNYVTRSKLSDNFSLKMEGVILRPLIEMKDNHGNRVITKLKLKDFGHSVLI